MTSPTPIDKHLSNTERFNRASNLAKRGGNSGGIPPDGTEPRIARLEASVSHIESDIHDIRSDVREIRSDIKDLHKADESNFRALFSAIIIVALGIAGLMAKGFGWL